MMPLQARGWTDPETLVANRAKGAGYDFFRSFEPRAADDLFIFRIDIGADAQLKRAAKGEHENLRRGPGASQYASPLFALKFESARRRQRLSRFLKFLDERLIANSLIGADRDYRAVDASA